MVSSAVKAVAFIVIGANILIGAFALKVTRSFQVWARECEKDETADEKPPKKLWDNSKKKRFTRSYMKERSVFGIIGIGIFMCFTSLITRPMRMITVVFDLKLFPGSEKLFYVMGAAATAFGGGLILTRAWRRFVRHKYYVELKNASWTSLLDPLGSAHSTTPRAAGVSSPRFADDGSVMDPMHTVVMKQMADLGGKRKSTKLELPYSFWITYKGVLTSEKGVIITSAIFGLFAVFAFAATYGNFKRARFLIGFLQSIYCIITLLLLRQVPECDTLLKLELTIHTVSFLVALIFLVLGTVLLSEWPNIWTIVIQISTLLGSTSIFVSAFFIVPEIVSNKEADAAEFSDPMSPKTRRKRFTDTLLNAINNAETFSQFMAHCCDEFCSENLLALLEIRAYKYALRKEMITEKRKVDEEKLKLERKSPRTSPRGATRMWSRKDTYNSQTKSGSEPPPIEEKKSGSNEPILETASGSGKMHLTLEIVDSDETSETSSVSGDVHKKSMAGGLVTRLRGFTEPAMPTFEKLRHHESIFTHAVEEGQFTQVRMGVVNLQAAEWDIHWRLALKQLGTKSAIVSHSDLSWFQKAQALFAKYIAVESPLQLNVSFKVRDKLKLLIGPDSVVEERLTAVHLLFIFDELIAEVLANVFDAFLRFQRRAK